MRPEPGSDCLASERPGPSTEWPEPVSERARRRGTDVRTDAQISPVFYKTTSLSDVLPKKKG